MLVVRRCGVADEALNREASPGPGGLSLSSPSLSLKALGTSQ